jgi:hypothetical protein
MSLLLVTAANRPYMDRIAPYLHTIQQHGSDFDRRVLITVGCQVAMPAELSTIEAIPLPTAQALGHTGNFCIQQGCHLAALGADDDDVIVFTDGDVRMQRALTVDELAWMRAIPQDTIAVGWNAGPDDTLHLEAGRISLDEAGRALFDGLLHRKVYNVGVIVCRAATYRAIYARYLTHWDAFSPHTPHYAANQFLMCACIAELGLAVWELPESVHTHGCFGLPAGIEEVGEGEIWAGDELVLFRHHWKC